MIKNFSIFKVDNKKQDKDPDYRISAKVGDEYVEIGAGWIKSGPKSKYISCRLSNPYKSRKGYVIVPEKADFDPSTGEVSPSDLPDLTTSPKTGDFGDFPTIM